MATAAITGTATPSIRIPNIVAGGKTIIITLTGETWVAAGGTFDAQRQNIINGIDSAQAEANGWDAQVKANLAVTTVVRTSNTVVTVTLSAQAAYTITALETITVTVPASAVTGAAQIVATPAFYCIPSPATFHVGSGGLDTNAGNSWATRRLTIQSAVTSAAVAGDTVYVAPGTYRETVTFGASGTAGNVISLIGDYTGANTSGTKGVVRITGSNNDLTATRGNCITASGKSYILVRGILCDLSVNSAIYFDGASANVTVDRCFVMSSGLSGIWFYGPSSAIVVSNCFLMGNGANAGIDVSDVVTADNTGTTISNCISIGLRLYGINISRIGGITVKNCTLMGATGALATANLNGGQTTTVNNCVIVFSATGLSAGSSGMITENYNTFFGNQTNRTNVSSGANSITNPPLFDARWFFEMVNGSTLVTPFDLASYSTLVELNSGTGAPSTDMRGASQVGSYREWGALEHQPALNIAAGSGGAVAISPFGGNIG